MLQVMNFLERTKFTKLNPAVTAGGSKQSSYCRGGLFIKSSCSKSECEVLHIQKLEFGDNKTLSPSKTSDLEHKFLNDGENVFAFVIGESVVAVHIESPYSKQDTGW